MKAVSKSLEETREIAGEMLAALSVGESAAVVALSGDLGAGKTAFSQAVGEILGVADTMQSPTFVIMKIYELEEQKWQRLVHIDAYRLEKESELLHLGWGELIADPQNLILIEWPERVAGIIPATAKRIDFTFVSEGVREISYE